MSINGNVGRSIPSLLTQLSGTFGYQSTNLWYFLFHRNTDSVVFTGASSVIQKAFILGLIQNINVPFPQIETESTNLEFNYASGYKSSGDVKITFLETQLFQSLNYLQSWFAEIYDVDQKVFKTGTSGKRSGNLIYTLTPLLSTDSYIS